MTEQAPRRAHLIAGGFPPGSPAGHDHDYARLRLLGLLADQQVPATVSNDFTGLETWLPLSRLLVTYVAGPYPDAAQCAVLRDWLDAGGHWLALHGTSGGKAERVEGLRQRRTVKMPHHALLGGFFLTHPPICQFRVDVAPGHAITADVPPGLDVVDEPYFVELQDPANTRILLSAKYGAAAVSSVVEPLYGADTSLLPDRRTRVLGYTKTQGAGAVTYFALGHCHNPAVHGGPRDPADALPETFHGVWEHPAFLTLLGNTIRLGAGR
jgi:uncharacterized protein